MGMTCVLCGSTDDVNGVKSLGFFGTRSDEQAPSDDDSKSSPCATFVLTKLFKLSNNECQALLEKFGREGGGDQWLKTCGPCAQFVEQFGRRYEQLLEIQREMDSMRNVAVGKLLGLNLEDGQGTGVEDEVSSATLRDRIQSYFRGASIRPCAMSQTSSLPPIHIEDSTTAELDLVHNPNSEHVPEVPERNSEIQVGTKDALRMRSQQEIRPAKTTDNEGEEEGGQREPNVSMTNQRYCCSFCEKSCRDQYDLTSHLRTHTGDRPFVCEICQKGFAHVGNKKRHMMTHTNERRSFACVFCDQGFASEESRGGHLLSHIQEKPYFCKLCSKEFSKSCNLTNHVRIHTKERPYGCEICGKGFPSSSSLTRHIRVHTTERPYKCKECSKTFTDRGNLKRHGRSLKHCCD